MIICLKISRNSANVLKKVWKSGFLLLKKLLSQNKYVYNQNFKKITTNKQQIRKIFRQRIWFVFYFKNVFEFWKKYLFFCGKNPPAPSGIVIIGCQKVKNNNRFF
jgi:hypothetical protein